MTDEYFELDLPVAPAVMVADEIVVEGTDVSEHELEKVIRSHLNLPQPEAPRKGIFGRIKQPWLLILSFTGDPGRYSLNRH